MFRKICFAVFLLDLLTGAAASAEDWPMFGRGPSRNAVSPEKNPPTFWQLENSDDAKNVKKNKNILWTAPLGCDRSYFASYGDPVVVDGRVWIGTNAVVEKEKYYAFLCLDEKTGKPLYRYLTPFMPFGRHGYLRPNSLPGRANRQAALGP